MQVDDFGVAHLREAKPYRDARAGEVRVGAVEDGVASFAGDSHLIEQNVARSLGAHSPTEWGREFSLGVSSAS